MLRQPPTPSPFPHVPLLLTPFSVGSRGSGAGRLLLCLRGASGRPEPALALARRPSRVLAADELMRRGASGRITLVTVDCLRATGLRGTENGLDGSSNSRAGDMSTIA